MSIITVGTADIEMLAGRRRADEGREIGALLVRPVVEMEFDLVVVFGAAATRSWNAVRARLRVQ